MLLGTYEGKARRCELTWTRYLKQELQGKVLLKEPKLTPAVKQQALEILDLVRKDCLLYTSDAADE